MVEKPPYFDEKTGYYCSQVKYHTRKKHAFIQSYLNIWIDHVGRKKKNIPSLNIIDLFASYGYCYCEEQDKRGKIDPIWEGSAALAASCLSQYPFPGILYLNSYNSDLERLNIQNANLIKITEQYGLSNKYQFICHRLRNNKGNTQFVY